MSSTQEEIGASTGTEEVEEKKTENKSRMAENNAGVDAEALLTWNPALEQYLVDTAEKCMGYAWIHKQAETMYSKRTIFIDLPTIIIGAVNGFISVGSNQIFQNDSYAPVYIGMVSLFVSLLNTISSYFSWGRRAEAHKIASNSYSRLCRMISVEMHTKPRSERMMPHKLLEYVQSNYNSLCENSPLVPPPIVNLFNKRFSGIQDFSLPEETNGLHAITVYIGDDPATAKRYSGLAADLASPLTANRVEIELPGMKKTHSFLTVRSVKDGKEERNDVPGRTPGSEDIHAEKPAK
jgi:hypothetical protein